MPSRRRVLTVALLGSLALAGLHGHGVAAQQPAVRGILAYDPTCENCEVVLNEILPPLEAQYGARLDIVKVDVSTVEGFDIWSAGAEAYGVPGDRKGVPLLFLGDQALSGQTEIAERLPSAIADGIASGGIPLPSFVTLTEADIAMWAAHGASPTAVEAEADPLAYALALVVLAGTVAGLALAALALWRSRPVTLRDLSERARVERSIAIPVLALAGLLVAAYLSYLHLSSSEAICPVGHCDAVQHSRWADLFGVPIAYLGVLTYGAILAVWLWGRSAAGARGRLPYALLLGIAAFGTAFSAYLTILELFVIRAVCMWCLLSAAIMTLVLIATVAPLRRSGRGRVDGDRDAPRVEGPSLQRA